MGGGDVESYDSQSTEEKTFTEVFEEQCPYFMSIGMTYDEFWYGEPERVKFYRDSHILQCKSKNQELWLQGMYFIRSIQTALDSKNKVKYFEKPIDIFPKTEAEKKAEAERERRKVIDFFTQLKQRWDNGNNRQLNS